MLISDLSVKRPVFASVLSLLILALGIVSFRAIPLREYPDIDPPVVSIDTTYPGAAASVVETRATQVIEDRIAGIEGIRFMSSSSSDGRSRISVEFDVNRDIDNAAEGISRPLPPRKPSTNKAFPGLHCVWVLFMVLIELPLNLKQG